MKKFYSLFISCLLITGSLLAQPAPNCNSQFTFVISNANFVQFTPATPGDSINTHHSWIFGDGTSNTYVFPSHTYLNPGIYTVHHKLTQYNSAGVIVCLDSSTAIITIATGTCNIQAQFLPHPDLTVSGLGWSFENLSAGITPNDSVKWNYGDGTSSGGFTGHHVYAQPGTYNVCLRIIKRTATGLSNCVSEICHSLIVPSPSICLLQASFTQERDTSSGQHTFHFHNTSFGFSPGDSIKWSFGDGTYSNALNPIHTYAQPGTYNVCIRVIKRTPNGDLTNCISENCHSVVVPQACNIAAHFTARPDSINTRKIYFTNSTIGSTTAGTATWTFGDGTTTTGWNAMHEYAQPGTYIVCLHVQLSATCSSNACETITVLSSPVNCEARSAFSFSRSAADPLLVNFQPNTINNLSQYTWSFGDGSVSQNPTASHHYAVAGNYTACLTVRTSPTCASTTCRTIELRDCSNLQASYHYYADSPVVNRVHFTAFANGTIAAQSWSILKIGSSITTPIILNQLNPVYTFHDTGYYRVCLRATFGNGCIKKYCETIHISHVIVRPGCNLQLYPNPATTQINAMIHLAAPQVLNAYVYNVLNILVKEKHQPGNAGNNFVEISIGNLPAGIYRYVLVHGNDTCTGLFQKF